MTVQPDLRFAPVKTARPRHLSPAEIERFNRDGFINPLDVFEADSAAENRQYFDDLLTQVPDVNVDRAWFAVVGSASESLEKLPARVHDTGVRRKQSKQFEFDKCQLHEFASYLDGSPWQIDPDVPAIDRFLALSAKVRCGGAA